MLSLIPANDKSGDAKLRKKDVRMAKVSLGIVFVFVVCHSIKWVPNIYELSQVFTSYRIGCGCCKRVHLTPDIC